MISYTVSILSSICFHAHNIFWLLEAIILQKSGIDKFFLYALR